MSARRLIVFEHATALGNKPAHELFEKVTWKRRTEGPARSFSDYEIVLDGKSIESMVTTVKVAERASHLARQDVAGRVAFPLLQRLSRAVESAIIGLER